jgi:aspartyl protease family protein
MNQPSQENPETDKKTQLQLGETTGNKSPTGVGAPENVNLQPETPVQERDFAQRMGGWMIALIWILLLAGAGVLAQQWLNERATAREASLLIDQYGRQALQLKADRYGQYLAKGSANDHEITFLLDTGASGISIPESVAERLGLERGRPFPVVTANGTIQVYRTQLDSIRIGPFVRYQVEAHINPAMQSELALLGMSFLRHYELLQRSEALTISFPQ